MYLLGILQIIIKLQVMIIKLKMQVFGTIVAISGRKPYI